MDCNTFCMDTYETRRDKILSSLTIVQYFNCISTNTEQKEE